MSRFCICCLTELKPDDVIIDSYPMHQSCYINFLNNKTKSLFRKYNSISELNDEEIDIIKKVSKYYDKIYCKYSDNIKGDSGEIVSRTKGFFNDLIKVHGKLTEEEFDGILKVLIINIWNEFIDNFEKSDPSSLVQEYSLASSNILALMYFGLVEISEFLFK